MALYEKYINASSLVNQDISFYQQCYDAAWSIGRVLDKTLTGNIIKVEMPFLAYKVI